jgi:hypothetical protein
MTKAPNSKLKASEEFQVPNFKHSEHREFELGVWSFSGAWMLVLGTSFRFA